MTAIETHRASRPGYPAMAVHRFDIATERNTGADMAWAVDFTGASVNARSLKSCAAKKLAREMVEAGEPDGPVEVWHKDKLSYTVRILHAFARFTVTENPRPHLTRHQEMPITAQAMRDQAPPEIKATAVIEEIEA